MVFATLLGPLPESASLASVLALQAEAGLEPLTDGRLPWRPGDPISATRRWAAAADLTDGAVKAVLEGPYSPTRRPGAPTGRRDRTRAAMAAAEALRAEVEALGAAGCLLVEIVEDAVDRIGTDERERHLFRDAHLRLLEGLAGTHLSLSIVGGSAWAAGPATILDPPYASLAMDLIAGPDNWRLVAETPGERGVICGVLGARGGAPGQRLPDGMDILLYAAHYAASTRGRGHARVGLGTAGSLAGLPLEEALAMLRRLGEAARLAGRPAVEQAAGMDPRAVSIRAAALGPNRPPRPRRDRPTAG